MHCHFRSRVPAFVLGYIHEGHDAPAYEILEILNSPVLSNNAIFYFTLSECRLFHGLCEPTVHTNAKF